MFTCRVNSSTTLFYLKKFFREVVKGCRDYENLLPMTIVTDFKNQVHFLNTLKEELPKVAFPMGYVKIGRLLKRSLKYCQKND